MPTRYITYYTIKFHSQIITGKLKNTYNLGILHGKISDLKG